MLEDIVENESFQYHEKRNPYCFDTVTSIANFVKERSNKSPHIGIVCGSGLSGIGSAIDNSVTIPYKDIPNFPQSSVQGHRSNLILGEMYGKSVVCMQGRFHFYEGYSMYTTTIGIRLMKVLGCKLVVITNASGGLNKTFDVGDIMIVNDHINLPGMVGANPLFGPNDERFGPRFPPTTYTYDNAMIDLAKDVANDLDIHGIREGVYCFQTGPQYETSAEARLLSLLGADAVGMSTVPEALAAVHMDMKVLCISLVTNIIVRQKELIKDNKVTRKLTASHEEVLETGKKRAIDVQRLVSHIIERLEI